VLGPVSFLDEHLSFGRCPFFGVFDANLLLLREVRKERNPAQLAEQLLAVRDLCDATQKRSKYW
jgi:hypothetical protein